MAIVHLSSQLAPYADGVESLTIDASRVCDLLETLRVRYPALGEALEQLAVAVDGEIYPHADYVALTPTSEVHFVPRLAGG